ncbi:alpha/beta fold hydrolase [Rhizobium leguminosarum]|uniref:alpha/beta fold hydrolase n=1 Tax=Rhizobium leguminosarum TaxID=384 RepID=UPI003F9DDCF4
MTILDRNSSLKQTFVETNGVKLNVVEQGEGPVVLFVHGFPDGWRGWRRQMAAVAAAGYRAISFDTRGYGESSKPEDAALYTVLYHVGDLVGILAKLGIERATLVGHDFGATVSWNAAAMRPDLFNAVFGLSVPPVLPGAGPSMLEMLKAAGKEEAFYMFRHMRVEADQEWADAASTFPGMLYWTSGLPEASEAWNPMDPSKSLNRPSPVGIPPFADREDVEAAIAGFKRDGFHGPLNIYRAMQPYFDQAKAFAGAKIQQPAFFAFGTADGMMKMRALKAEDLIPSVPNLTGFLPIEGVGHWPQLEASEIVNEALVTFLEKRNG